MFLSRRATILIVALPIAILAVSVLAQQGWSQLQSLKRGNSGTAVSSVFYDGDEVWIVGARGLVGRSYDEGRTFQETDLRLTEGLNDVFLRKDRIWIVGDSGTIVKSTDRGRTFKKTIYSPRHNSGDSNNGQGIDLYSVQFIDKERGFIVGDRGLILGSTDGGNSWTEQRSSTDAQLFHLALKNERAWVIGTGGIILHTDNGGRNWYRQFSGVSSDLNRVCVVSDRTLLVTGDAGTLLRSENGGATWERVSLPTRDPLFGISFIDDSTGWIVGYKGRVIRTYDAGRHWVDQMSGTSDDLFSVSFYKNRGYAVGRDGVMLTYYEKR